MIVRLFLHPDTGGISSPFGCGGKATGAVVDPVTDRMACPRVAAG